MIRAADVWDRNNHKANDCVRLRKLATALRSVAPTLKAGRCLVSRSSVHCQLPPPRALAQYTPDRFRKPAALASDQFSQRKTDHNHACSSAQSIPARIKVGAAFPVETSAANFHFRRQLRPTLDRDQSPGAGSCSSASWVGLTIFPNESNSARATFFFQVGMRSIQFGVQKAYGHSFPRAEYSPSGQRIDLVQPQAPLRSSSRSKRSGLTPLWSASQLPVDVDALMFSTSPAVCATVLFQAK